MRIRLRRRAADERGQALVEFALLIPVLLIIVIAVIDFGKLFHTYQVMTNAAREGARFAALADEDITAAKVYSVVKKALAPAVADTSAGGVHILTDEAGGCGALSSSPTGGYVLLYQCGWNTATDSLSSRVALQYDYEAVVLDRFLALAAGTTKFTLSTRMTMRNE